MEQCNCNVQHFSFSYFSDGFYSFPFTFQWQSAVTQPPLGEHTFVAIAILSHSDILLHLDAAGKRKKKSSLTYSQMVSLPDLLFLSNF